MPITKLTLSAEDRKKIKKELIAVDFIRPIWLIVMSLGIFFSLRTVLSSDSDQLTKILVTAFWVIFVGLTYYGLELAKNFYKLLSEDYQLGEKEILVGKLREKNEIRSDIDKEHSTRFLFCIEEEKFEVSIQDYNTFEEGQFLAIHRTPKAKQILLIENAG